MRTHKLKTALLVLAPFICSNVWGQATAPSDAPAQTATQSPAAGQDQTPPPAGATASGSSLSFARIDFSGMLDGYYGFNNNHPESGVNKLYNFNDRTDQVDLNLAKLTVNRDPSPIGFRVDVGFGRAFEIEKTPHPDPELYRFIEQSYVSVKPKNWKGEA